MHILLSAEISVKTVNVRIRAVKTIRIATPSITYAEKGRRAFASHRIPARIVRLDPHETENGCAFALELTGAYEIPGLRDILVRANVRFSAFL